MMWDFNPAEPHMHLAQSQTSEIDQLGGVVGAITSGGGAIVMLCGLLCEYCHTVQQYVHTTVHKHKVNFVSFYLQS